MISFPHTTPRISGGAGRNAAARVITAVVGDVSIVVARTRTRIRMNPLPTMTATRISIGRNCAL
ncbi:hypothetical protein [Dactylosporangium sp. CA-092794]|uniref:hypothetical protein n=1 Tax=Dactylosporangium sp. CA-092794 TaxID=3239929 RepID=UPI003D928C62